MDFLLIFIILAMASILALAAFTVLHDHKQHVLEEYRKCSRFRRKMGFPDRRMQPDRRSGDRAFQTDRRKHNIKDDL